MQAIALAQRYIDIRDRNRAAGVGPWSDKLMALVTAANGVLTRGGHVQDIAPAQWTSHMAVTGPRDASGNLPRDTTYTREVVQATPFVQAALQASQQMRDALESQHSNDYQDIVNLAADQCGPARPPMMSDAEVTQIHSELLATIGSFPSGMRNQAAQRVMAQALQDNDQHTLYALLGGGMDRAFTAWGDVSGRSLRTMYAQRVAARPENAPPPGSLAAVIPSGQGVTPAISLIALQQTDYALTDLVPAVLAYFDYEMAQTRAYLR